MLNLDLSLYKGEINKEVFNIINTHFPLYIENQKDSSSIYIKVEINDYDMNMTIKRYNLFDILKENIAIISANKIYEKEELKEIIDYIIRYNEFAPYNSSKPATISNINGTNTLVISKKYWGYNKKTNSSYDGEAIVECKFANKEMKDNYLEELLNNRGPFYVSSIGYINDLLNSDNFTKLKDEIFSKMTKEEMIDYLSSLDEEELSNILRNMTNEDFFMYYYTKGKQYKKCKQKD